MKPQQPILFTRRARSALRHALRLLSSLSVSLCRRRRHQHKEVVQEQRGQELVFRPQAQLKFFAQGCDDALTVFNAMEGMRVQPGTPPGSPGAGSVRSHVLRCRLDATFSARPHD